VGDGSRGRGDSRGRRTSREADQLLLGARLFDWSTEGVLGCSCEIGVREKERVEGKID